MKKKHILIGVIAGVSLFLTGAWGSSNKYFEITKNLNIFVSLFREINTHYVDQVDPSKLIETAIQGMLSQLDPYTTYISESEREAFDEQRRGRYAGIGAAVTSIHNRFVITQIYQGFPAHRAGLQVGDAIIQIDTMSLDNLSFSDVRRWLRSHPSTPVELTVKRANQDQPLTFSMDRAPIVIPNISYSKRLHSEVGFIKLDHFNPGAGREFYSTLRDLLQQGIKAVVIDLRDNSGGSLYEAIHVVNAFIPKHKKVASIRGQKKERNESFKTLYHPISLAIPVVILVGNRTASAAEIVAGALQDYDRAVLIGQRTFGKGLVQTVEKLPYNTLLKITTARYYIPSNRDIKSAHPKDPSNIEKDSLLTPFYTQSGRVVYNTGGIKPDVVVLRKKPVPWVDYVMKTTLLFEYATQYCSQHPKPTHRLSTTLTDDEYDTFAQWIKNRAQGYVSPLENGVDNLIKTSKTDSSSQEVMSVLVALKRALHEEYKKYPIQYKKEIKPLLEAEIAYHYNLVPGRMEVNLRNSSEVNKALTLLSDTLSFQAILRPN